MMTRTTSSGADARASAVTRSLFAADQRCSTGPPSPDGGGIALPVLDRREGIGECGLRTAQPLTTGAPVTGSPPSGATDGAASGVGTTKPVATLPARRAAAAGTYRPSGVRTRCRPRRADVARGRTAALDALLLANVRCAANAARRRGGVRLANVRSSSQSSGRPAGRASGTSVRASADPRASNPPTRRIPSRAGFARLGQGGGLGRHLVRDPNCERRTVPRAAADAASAASWAPASPAHPQTAAPSERQRPHDSQWFPTPARTRLPLPVHSGPHRDDERSRPQDRRSS